ncbi:MAG: rhodanese-like domain-containing protein [Candidatus Paceibacterota bacterium]
MKIIDVRTKEEFDEEHLIDAVNLDVSEIANGKLPDLPKDAPILLYCASGGRSAFAKQALERAGFTNITNGGGLEGLKSQGFKV